MSSVFSPVGDRYGVRLALVFGNHAPGGLCPYFAAARCHHCDIGAGEGARFHVEANHRRLAWFQEHHRDILPQVAHLVLYNSGSVLNPREMPREVLEEILGFARSLPALRVVSLDSREAYITPGRLERVAGLLGPDRTVRPILGLETVNDRYRNHLLEKQMPRNAVERAFRAVSRAAEQCGANRVGLDVNIVVAGPGTEWHTAVTDAVETARYAWQTGQSHGISIDLHLHPYYPGARGRARFPHHDRCSLEVLAEVVTWLCALRDEIDPMAGLFIGWEDEGHDLDQDRRALETAKAREAFLRFNGTQEPAALRSLRTDADLGRAAESVSRSN